ncbi:hypothetical protein BDV10DRAFT_166714 [Aspergillus recurvatus]
MGDERDEQRVTQLYSRIISCAEKPQSRCAFRMVNSGRHSWVKASGQSANDVKWLQPGRVRLAVSPVQVLLPSPNVQLSRVHWRWWRIRRQLIERLRLIIETPLGSQGLRGPVALFSSCFATSGCLAQQYILALQETAATAVHRRTAGVLAPGNWRK